MSEILCCNWELRQHCLQFQKKSQGDFCFRKPWLVFISTRSMKIFTCCFSHSLLLDKLASYRQNGWSVQWVRVQVMGHTQSMVISGFYSGWQSVTTGVPPEMAPMSLSFCPGWWDWKHPYQTGSSSRHSTKESQSCRETWTGWKRELLETVWRLMKTSEKPVPGMT